MPDQPMSPPPPPQGSEPQPMPASPPLSGPATPSALPPEFQSALATADQKQWGMIAHLSALAGLLPIPFGNVLGPLVVWLIKKDESRFVAFHAKQALFFQLAASVIVYVVAVISIPLTMICIGWLTLSLAILAGLGAMVYSVIGGIQVNSGKDFEYYFIGEKVRNWK